MTVTFATWNINSVRFRLDLVEQFLKTFNPDILCLQETKCPDGSFPEQMFRKLGYDHIALNGQKAYHGVATISRLPFSNVDRMEFCGKGDTRHIATTFGKDAHPALEDVTLHNFYVPAGGDKPDLMINEKFVHKRDFLSEMTEWSRAVPTSIGKKAILVGDLNIAPLETDVWSHKQLLKVVSHTPQEVEWLDGVQESGKWVDVVRQHIPPEEKLFTWWSYRSPDWAAANKGRRLDHIWASDDVAKRTSAVSVLKDVRGWEKPSDHAPVLATLT